jgi:hypothetical protein
MKLKFRCVLLFACYAVTLFYFVPISYAQSSRSEREIPTDDDPLLQPLPPGIRLRVFIHTPRVVEPNHLGTCDPITTDSYTYAVAPWRIPPGGIKWKFSESTVPTGVAKVDALTAIQDAFGTWNSEFEGNNLLAPFEYDGKTTVKNTRLDGTNAVLWKSLCAGIMGETYVWYNKDKGYVAEVDTAFNNRHPWFIFNESLGECQSPPDAPDAYDVQNIATHEFGHWIGLGDVFAEDLTMYLLGAGGELKKRTLGTGDKSGVDSKYPPLP